jgi:hypothetical protein
MTLSLNCKDAGDPVCTHTMTGETEEDLFANAKEAWYGSPQIYRRKLERRDFKSKDHFRSLIKKT